MKETLAGIFLILAVIEIIFISSGHGSTAVANIGWVCAMIWCFTSLI